MQELFQAAVADAEVAEADEIVSDLIAINNENSDLMMDPDERVLMVTWTSYPGYDELVGSETTVGVEVWSTVAPRVQEFCRESGLTGSELSLRLEQLLGLPPDNGKDRMVELWVPQEALFRPSPDGEITDSVAQLDFPTDTTPDYMAWIDALTATSYGEGGYPWTRLGYTYDWNPDTSDVGMSEFVITKDSTVIVASVTPTSDYCR